MDFAHFFGVRDPASERGAAEKRAETDNGPADNRLGGFDDERARRRLANRTPPTNAVYRLRRLLLLLVGAAAGCGQSHSGVQLWFIEDLRRSAFRFETDDAVGIDANSSSATSGGAAKSGRRAEIRAARNETVSFQFAFRAGESILRRPRVRVGAFASDLGQTCPARVEVFRIHPVRIERFPAWHVRTIPRSMREAAPPDVLVPLDAPRGGLPAEAAPGEIFHFWVDVFVPESAAGGEYVANVDVLSGEAVAARVELKLVVQPFALPDDFRPLFLAEVDHEALLRLHPAGSAASDANNERAGHAADADRIVHDTMDTLRRHGLTPVLHRLAPRVRVDSGGRVEVDWARYDAVVGRYLSSDPNADKGTVSLWPLPAHELLAALPQAQGAASPFRLRVTGDYLLASVRHFQDNGWLKYAYLLPPAEFAGNPAGDPGAAGEREWIYRWIGETFDRGGVRAPVVSTAWPQDLRPMGWTAYRSFGAVEHVDVWAPPAQFYDPRVMGAQRSAGRRTWVSMDRPPYSGTLDVSAPASFVRVLSWQGVKLGAEVVFLGCVNSWPDRGPASPPEDRLGHAPSTLLYPGTNFGLDRPVPSVRLKRLRQSAQDARYRTLAERHGLGHVTAALVNSLVVHAGAESCRTHFADGRRIGWPADERLFDLARKILATEIADLAAGARGEASDRIAQGSGPPASALIHRAAEWRRLMLATRQLAPDIEGIRARRLRARESRGLEIEAFLRIENRTRIPVSGDLNLEPSAPGGPLRFDQAEFPAFAPGATHRSVAAGQSSATPAFPDGWMPVRLTVTAAEGGAYHAGGRFALVTAVPRPAPVELDGDLSDWPLGDSNVASRFRPIADGSVRGRLSGASRPPAAPDEESASDTTAFVMRDAEALFVGIHCTWDGRRAALSHRNEVRCEDMIPMEDELVELLFDPLNAGTRSPSHLYRIVVKPSGAYLAHRGITPGRACKPESPWAADIRVATRTHPARWTAEMRIPLGAFDAPATRDTVWGMNVTRFDAVSQEYSTWSGARGSAYDPLSLGNLYLP